MHRGRNRTSQVSSLAERTEDYVMANTAKTTRPTAIFTSVSNPPLGKETKNHTTPFCYYSHLNVTTADAPLQPPSPAGTQNRADETAYHPATAAIALPHLAMQLRSMPTPSTSYLPTPNSVRRHHAASAITSSTCTTTNHQLPGTTVADACHTHRGNSGGDRNSGFADDAV
jgi:hypothetical protein